MPFKAFVEKTFPDIYLTSVDQATGLKHKKSAIEIFAEKPVEDKKDESESTD